MLFILLIEHIANADVKCGKCKSKIHVTYDVLEYPTCILEKETITVEGGKVKKKGRITVFGGHLKNTPIPPEKLTGRK